MKLKKDISGFNVVELLIVAGVMMILIVLAGSISSKYADRRSVDSVVETIAIQLNYAKLLASSSGVQHQINIDFDDTTDPAHPEVSIDILRGTGNVGTLAADFESINNQNKFLVRSDLDVVIPIELETITFNPDGTILDDTGALIPNGGLTISVKPEDPGSINTKIFKCGNITVFPIIRINSYLGRWNLTTDSCRAIVDDQETI